MSSRTTRPSSTETLRRAARWTATPAGLAVLFATGLLLRLLLGRGGGFPGDIRIFQDWARVLGETGPGDFYDTASFADYPPGYLYVLWPLGELAKVLFDGTLPVFLVKLPAMLADVGLAWVVMRLAALVAGASGNERWWVRPAAAAAILFNPPIVFLSAVWGQVDSVAAFYALAGILLVAPRDASVRAEAGGAALLALAFSTKPQTAFLLPVIALVLLLRHVRGREVRAGELVQRIGVPLLSFVVVWCALGVPFGLSPAGLLDFYATAGSTYPVTSVWAFNFWGIAGFWRPDSGPEAFQVFGLNAVAAGVMVFSAAACYVLIRVFRAVKENRPQVEVILGAGAAVVCLSFALLTRIHERYLFLALACLAPLIVYPRVRAAFAALALLYMVNLYFPWVYYNEQEGISTLKVGWLFDLLYGTEVDAAPKKLLSLATAALCVLFAWWVWDMLKLAPRREAVAPAPARAAAGRPGDWTFGLHPIGRRGAALAGIVFLVVLPTRLAGLSSPQEMYFDEIYHARTAGEYLEGKDAYEYTHPPLGKELMALSTAAFSGWGAESAGEAPALLDSGAVDSDGTTAVWAAPAPSGDTGVLWAATLGAGCAFEGVTGGAELEFVPHAIAVDSSISAPVEGPPIAGAYVAGSAEGEAVVARWYGDAEQWREKLGSRAQVVDVAGSGDVAFAVDEAGTLWHVQPGGATALREGAAAVAYDPDAGGVWVAVPDERLVVAYDAGGSEIARPSTYGNPDGVVVVHDADRVLAFDAEGGLIEGIDNQSKAWVGQLESDAGALVPGPGKGLAFALSGRRVDVLEPRGLTVIGETALPRAPDALVPVRSDGTLAAVTGEDLACVAGDNSFAWRLPGALSGALIPALVFLLALRCTGSRFVAVLAAILMALDGLGFAMSRIATLDSQATAHIVAAWLAALSVFFHARRAREGLRGARRLGVIWLGATCLFLGFAIATKWVGVYSFLAIALLIVGDLIARQERGVGALFPKLGAGLAFVAAAVALVPLAIYVLSYVPYLSLDHSFGDLARLQHAMFEYHSQLKEGHPYSSPWYGWPVGYKAVAFWAGTSGTETGAITAIANPVVLLGGLWALVVTGVAAWRQRAVGPLVVVGAALVQYLPWVLVSRAAFLYHYLPVVPFLAVALAWVLGRERPSRRRTYETASVVAAAAVVFALTLPELDGWYTSPEFHESLHSWFPWMF